MKAWDEFKAGSIKQMEKATAKLNRVSAKLRRADRKHVNVVSISEEEIMAFRSLEDLHASVASLKAQAAANKVAYKKALALQWGVLEDKYGLGGKFFVDMDEGELYQLGKKL